MKRLFLLLAFTLLAQPAWAERIKDIANIDGIRTNQLVGYGIVAGLDDTGDTSDLTFQGLANLMGNLGVNPYPGKSLYSSKKNVASVMVTASLPPFAKPGQNLDVTVSALSGAKSLRGGTLMMTPLKGADGQIYAIAQGSLMVGGAGASAAGSSAQINHLSAGRIPSGATVERAVNTRVGDGDFINLELKEADFTTASRVIDAIERGFGKGVAMALDSRLIQVRAPTNAGQRVAFLARLENLSLNPGTPAPRVVINPRTGSVVMNQKVALDACAVAHGNLSVVVDAPQPQFGQGADIQVKQENGSLMNVKAGASLAEVVKALNALGANPMDLLAILQAMKAAGALRAELEVI